MSPVRATLDQAARWAAASPTTEGDWNPVYRALCEEPMPPPHGAPDHDSPDPDAPDPNAPDPNAPDPESLELVIRQLTAPALLVVAVSDSGGTRRLRIAVDPGDATVEISDGDAASRWTHVPLREVPALIAALLEESGLAPAPARMSIERGSQGLRLTPQQNRIARAALDRGLTPAQAYAAVPDLDQRLRDALAATGPRIALSLTLHDPTGMVTERPVTWSRLWVSGEHGLYRLDAPSTPGGAIHAVNDGDVLGTVMPVLDEGLRFTAARSAAGEQR